MLRLEEITADNLDAATGVTVRPDQEHAVESVAAEIRRRGGTLLTTTWHPGESGPGGFYRALGFRTTGELSGGQVVGELRLA